MARAARLIPLGLLLLVAVPYAQVREFGFVNVDDQLYVTGNALVRGGLGWGAAAECFTRFEVGNYHPLTLISHQLDVTLFGLDAGWHHLVNVLLHVLDTLLLFALLRSLTGRPWLSALVAALFAVHPLHVESVAWISERKDVLSTLFLLLALQAWVAWVRRPRPASYALALGLFAAGLLAKPMLVTLPALLLLLDAWPLGRPLSRATVLEKLPFAALAGASALATWLAQAGGGATSSLAIIPMSGRAANAVVAATSYLGLALWPTGLASFYPHPLLSGAGLQAWRVAASVLVLVALSAVAWRQRSGRPWLAFGWLWFLVTLVPVIGLVQVGTQAMADRYTYVPLIGPLVSVAWAGAELLERLRAPAPVRWAAGLVPVLALAAACMPQVATWKDSDTLHRHALAVTERNWIAWSGLGSALSEQGRLDEAVGCFEEALRIRPYEPQALNGLGVALGRLGRSSEAEVALRRAVELLPGLADAWYNLGVALGAQLRHAEAAAAFERAVALHPYDALAWGNLGFASLRSGDPGRARACWERLRSLDPAQAERLGRWLGPPAR